jgi:hypothetical protein
MFDQLLDINQLWSMTVRSHCVRDGHTTACGVRVPSRVCAGLSFRMPKYWRIAPLISGALTTTRSGSSAKPPAQNQRLCLTPIRCTKGEPWGTVGPVGPIMRKRNPPSIRPRGSIHLHPQCRLQTASCKSEAGGREHLTIG